MDGRKKQSKDYTSESQKTKAVFKHTGGANPYNFAKQLEIPKNGLYCVKRILWECASNHIDPNSDSNVVPDQNNIPGHNTAHLRNHDSMTTTGFGTARERSVGKKNSPQVLFLLIYILLHGRHSFWQR